MDTRMYALARTSLSFAPATPTTPAPCSTHRTAALAACSLRIACRPSGCLCERAGEPLLFHTKRRGGNTPVSLLSPTRMGMQATKNCDRTPPSWSCRDVQGKACRRWVCACRIAQPLGLSGYMKKSVQQASLWYLLLWYLNHTLSWLNYHNKHECGFLTQDPFWRVIPVPPSASTW